MKLKVAELNAFVTHFKQFPCFAEKLFFGLIEDTNEEISLKILARFQITLQEAELSIREGLRELNQDKIWKTCHKMAGTSELLGFQGLAKTSKSLSHSVRASSDLDGDFDEVAAYLRTCEKLNLELKSCCPNLSLYLE